MSLTFIRRSQLLPLLLMISLLVMISGCEEGSEITITEPVEDPAEAMIAHAAIVEGTMQVAIDGIRNQLNLAHTNLDTMTFSSPGANQILEDLVELSNGKVWGSGIINPAGIIVGAYPTEMESMVGTSWIDRAEVDNALTEISMQIGEALDLNGIHSALFTRSIGFEHPIKGVVFSAIQLDTLFQVNMEFAGIDTVAEYEFFALDETGEVLFNTAGEYIGADLTDSNSFSVEQSTVALSMIDGSITQGSTTVDLTNAPGGEGMQYLGWVHLPLVSDHFWVLAVSSTVPEEEQ